jgi:predicted ATP-dependent endonuclease of OLD family
MFLPHFLREHFKDGLYQRYISILEIGGSHAHRLRPLIELLALPTLIITDLDSGAKSEPDKPVSGAAPVRGSGMETMNETLRGWVPKLKALDDLLDAAEDKRVARIDDFSAVYAAYQSPVQMKFKSGKGEAEEHQGEALSYTFEDALALANIGIFRSLTASGLVGKFREAIADAENLLDLTKRFHAAVKGSDKGKFALDVIFGVEPSTLAVPGYIQSGLVWLEKQLANRDERNLVRKAVVAAQSAKEVSDGDGT